MQRAAYIHIPFCISKCYYCDFNSYPGLGHLFDAYSDAVRREIEHAPVSGAQAATLYIGGGTPTVMNDQQLYAMVDSVRFALSLPKDAEATIEANPATITASSLDALITMGLNRISIGIQSLEDETLSKLGRRHTSDDAYNAVINARLAGFANISLDLIYSLPEQTVDAWGDTVNKAIDLSPEHISLYELTIESGTPFADLLAQGALTLPGEEEQIEMYSVAESLLEAAGYEHYEISNYARPGFRCRHNQFYWQNEEYYGFGAGAVSYLDRRRVKNLSNPSEYIERVTESGSAVENSEELSPDAQMGETMMLGLRMLDGVDCEAFRGRFGVEPADVYAPELERLTRGGLLELADSRIRLTKRGVLLANEVMQEFLRC